MTSTPKFYRTRLTIDILSEDTPFNGSLEDAAYAISEGDCVGGPTTLEPTELTGKQAADALYEFASEPAFFRLDDDGEDTDEL